MFKRSLPLLCTLASLCLCLSAGADELPEELSISGPIDIALSFDSSIDETVEENSSGAGSRRSDCGGGSLLGAMDCVSEKIGGAGNTDGATTQTRTSRTVQHPASASMGGRLTPIAELIDADTVALTLSGAISAPRVATSAPKEKRVQLQRQAMAEHAALTRNIDQWDTYVSTTLLRGEGYYTADFSRIFNGLQLFKKDAPREAKFTVYWKPAHCEELENQFRQMQTDYIAHASAMPVLDQLELVTGTMEQIEEVLNQTAEGVTGVNDQISEVTELTSINAEMNELMDETSNFSSTLTGALERIKQEANEKKDLLLEQARLTELTSGIQEGLKQTSETMEQTAGAIGNINEELNKFKALVASADGSASEQLNAFKGFFDDVNGRLEPLVSAIPGLGVFLGLYSKAIGQIAESAERIEAVVDERNQMARDLGLPDIYVKLRTAKERAEDEKRRMHREIEELAQRIAQECPSIDLSGESFSEIDAIEQAKHRARSACEDQQKGLSERSRIIDEYRAASRGYSAQAVVEAEESYRQGRREYYDELALKRKAMNGRTSNLSQDEKADILRYIKTYYTAMNQSSRYKPTRDRLLSSKYRLDRNDREAIESYFSDRKRTLLSDHRQLEELRAKRERFDRAQDAYQALQNNNADYRKCVKNHILHLAQENGWDKDLVRVLNFDSM